MIYDLKLKLFCSLTPVIINLINVPVGSSICFTGFHQIKYKGSSYKIKSYQVQWKYTQWFNEYLRWILPIQAYFNVENETHLKYITK